MSLFRRLIAAAILFAASLSIAAREDREATRKAQDIVQKSSDDELQEILTPAEWNDYQKKALYVRFKEAKIFKEMEITDFALNEIIRRGGADWEQRLDKLCTSAKKSSSLHTSAPILTALRRIQKKPDPLQIDLTLPLKGLESDFPSLPEVEAMLVNRDVDKRSFTFTKGGDYRSGRQARWRFHVTRKDGTVVPVKQVWGVGGGLVGTGTMEVGGTWKTMLKMGSFMYALEPGEYQVRVQYHDESAIANQEDLTGLIIFSSAPFTLSIKPMTLSVTATETKRAKDLLYAIPENAPLKVVAGTYSEDFHDLIAPESPQGKLLTMGFNAVPALLDELYSEKLSTSRRAWTLSLLFSVTGSNDPRDSHSVLGSYEFKEGGWEIAGGAKRHEVMGIGLGSSGSVTGGGGMDEAKQREFTERWRKWKTFIKITEPKPGPEF
jgi:hypothetical protein